MTPLAEIRSLVDAQAEDEGLWFDAETASEAYLQRHLRKLHSLIEHHTTDEPPASTDIISEELEQLQVESNHRREDAIKYRKGLKAILHLPINADTDLLEGFAGAVRELASKALTESDDGSV